MSDDVLALFDADQPRPLFVATAEQELALANVPTNWRGSIWCIASLTAAIIKASKGKTRPVVGAVYRATKEKIALECAQCGNQWSGRVSHALRGASCEPCAARVTGVALRTTLEQHRADLCEKGRTDIICVEMRGTDKRGASRALYRCADPACRHEWEAKCVNITRPNNPTGCPECSKRNQISRPGKEWLDLIGLPDDAQHREVTLTSTRALAPGEAPRRIVVDGFDPVRRVIFELQGSLWHGDPRKYRGEGRDKLLPGGRETIEDAYQRTITRMHSTASFLPPEEGYTFAEMWESDFARIKKLPDFQRKSALRHYTRTPSRFGPPAVESPYCLQTTCHAVFVQDDADDMQEVRRWSRHRLTQALELHGLPGPATARDHDLADAVKRLQAVEPDAQHVIIRRPAPLAQAA